ncbi:aldehyde dehydrogenase [Palleronia sp.]|uniref:aldehyde dehydrogenase n=1 Tax=Palleronia sp. TaxID=1940284 RepID=UPI0035C831C0
MFDQSAIDALRDAPVTPGRLLIGGDRREAGDGATLVVISPLNGARLTTIADATSEDVEDAVHAARAAFEDRRWAGQPPAARKKVLLEWADLIEREWLDLAVLGVRDNGTEIAMAGKAEVGSAVGAIRWYAEAIDKIYGEIAPTADAALGLIHREPVGVIGAIVPWNFPLMIGTWKLAPALAAGNSVVLKPSETASLTLIRIAELALEAGLPKGVLNVVTGRGARCGQALAMSMDVDALVFTGSGPTGRRLLEASAKSNLKRVYLELGGKSPNIVFDDVEDLAEAAKVSAAGIFRNSGQVCVAGSRLLVQKGIARDFTDAMARIASEMRVGDPLDLGTQAGAVSSEGQLAQNLEHVRHAQEQGATVSTGGTRIMQETGGTYMAPTVVSDVTPDLRIFNDEVFGPVVTVTPFEDEAEAVLLANATEYGLAAGVWTANLGRAHRMIRAVRAGVVHVNTYGGADITVPLGGIKQSGNGHDKSLHAFDKFLDLKTAWIKL